MQTIMPASNVENSTAPTTLPMTVYVLLDSFLNTSVVMFLICEGCGKRSIVFVVLGTVLVVALMAVYIWNKVQDGHTFTHICATHIGTLLVITVSRGCRLIHK